MTAKRYDWWRVSALGGILFFCLGVSSVLGGEVEDRIQALEKQQRANAEELARLKGEQIEMKKDALAAAAALPDFTYRQGSGMTIMAADGSYGFRTRLRWHYRLLFFPDKDVTSRSGFSQALLRLRRVYPYFTYYWDKGFYEFDYQQNLGAEQDRTINIQKMEFHIHGEKTNPYFPEFTIGPRVSGYFNAHDTNWGSSKGGLFDRSMFQDGAGIGAGSQVNAMALDWHDLSLGMGSIKLFEVVFSSQGLRNQDTVTNPDSERKSALVSTHIAPFDRLKNKWLSGTDFSFAVMSEALNPTLNNRDLFRVRTTERQRFTLIDLATSTPFVKTVMLTGRRYYLTPGFGWKFGPYWLRTAGGFNFAHLSLSPSSQRGLVRGSMWRIAHELWVWSGKGLLTGSNGQAGSVMVFTGFERDDYGAPSAVFNGCASNGGGGNCKNVSAHNYNVGAWYVVRPGFELGTEYGGYVVNKLSASGSKVLEKPRLGSRFTFNTLEFGVRTEW